MFGVYDVVQGAEAVETSEAAETSVIGTAEAVGFEMWGPVAFEIVEARVVVEIEWAIEAL